MRQWQKPVALLLAITLLVTCAISGLVLPASAENSTSSAPVDLFNGLGDFEGDSWTTIFTQRGNSEVVADPCGGTNKVLALGQVGEDGTVTGCGDNYLNLQHLYNAVTGTYNASIDITKTYLFSVDVYGAPCGGYAMSGAEWVPGGQSWKQFGNNEATWKNYQYVFNFKNGVGTNLTYSVSIGRGSTNEPYSKNYTTTLTYIDNLTITEYVYAESMTLDKTEATIARKGNTVQLAAVASPAGSHFADTIAWTSNNTAVATVDANGKVTAVSGGTATITATCGDSLSATCTVTVTDYNLMANGDFEDDETCWVMFRNDGNGTVEFGAEGAGKDGSKGAKVTFTNTTDNKLTQQCGLRYTGKFFDLLEENETYIFSFDCKWEGTGEGIWFEPAEYPGTGYTGWTKTDRTKSTDWTTITMEFTTGTDIPADGGYMWYAQAIMYNSKTGTGTAYFDNFKLVKKSDLPTLTDIALNQTEATIARQGSTVQLTATAVPAAADISGLTWESSNTAVATVDANGKVTAVSGGTATITATCGTVSKQCTVTVTDYNIMTNGDFEDGTSSWYSGKEYIVAGQGKDGGTGFYVNRQDSGAYQSRYKDKLLGKMQPSTEYVLRFDYKTSGTAYGEIYFDKSFGTIVSSSYGSSYTSLNGGITFPQNMAQWTTLSITFTTPDSISANPPYEISLFHRNGTGEVWFDNVQICKKSDLPALTGVTLDKTEATTLQKGSTLSLTATMAPVSAYFASFTWESSNAAVATVDRSGVVTAKKGGTTTITATADGYTASVVIHVSYSVEHFVNGSMDDSTEGISFGSDVTYAFNDTAGVNGTRALEISQNGTYYFKGQSFELKPNSYYLYSVVAHTSDGKSATIELGNAGSNNNNVLDVTSIDNTSRAVSGTAWQPFVNCLKTGEAPSMNSSWNLLIKVSNLTAGTSMYVDNISFKLIDESETDVLSTDFDTPTWGGNYWNNGQVTIAAGEGMNDSNAMVLPNTKQYWNVWRDVNTGLESNALYKVSFYTRATAEWIAANPNAHLMWGGTNAKDAQVYTPNGTKFKATADWELNEYYIWTGSNTTLPSNVFYLNIASASGDGYLYFDNFTFERVDSGNALVTKASNCTMYVYAGSKPIALPAFLADVPAGTEVTVEVWDNVGYLMVPGSLAYVKTDGTTIPILNKSNDTFGSGDGRVYKFTKPEGAGRIVCTAQKADQNSYAMDTVGTSVHDNGEGSYDGIRFLTRMNVTSFAASEDGMTVTYNGATATVMEIGSLLVREGNEATLTYDDAKWKAVAYKKGEIDTMKLVDYTSRYIDFTVIMMTEYTGRRYSAKGYMCLDTDGDGVADATVYSTNYQTDSIDSAVARL